MPKGYREIVCFGFGQFRHRVCVSTTSAQAYGRLPCPGFIHRIMALYGRQTHWATSNAAENHRRYSVRCVRHRHNTKEKSSISGGPSGTSASIWKGCLILDGIGKNVKMIRFRRFHINVWWSYCWHLAKNHSRICNHSHKHMKLVFLSDVRQFLYFCSSLSRLTIVHYHSPPTPHPPPTKWSLPPSTCHHFIAVFQMTLSRRRRWAALCWRIVSFLAAMLQHCHLLAKRWTRLSNNSRTETTETTGAHQILKPLNY